MPTLESSYARTIKTILLVDDDVHFVKLVKDSLEEEGYTVFCGYDGWSALELAQTHKPDVILLDINMPVLNGFKAFQRLRSEDHTRRIPVIFITDMISQIIYPVVQSAPRVAHIKKPLDLLDLSSLLRLFFDRYCVAA